MKNINVSPTARRAPISRIALGIASLLLLGCVAEKSLEEEQRCPCAPGWSCDSSQQICIAVDAAEAPDTQTSTTDGSSTPGNVPGVAGNDGSTGPATPDTQISTGDAPPAAPCIEVTYPASGFYGMNALVPDATTFMSDQTSTPYELAADLIPGATITIKMTMSADTLARVRIDAGPVPGFPHNAWWLSGEQGWLITNFNFDTGEQVFMSQAGVLRPEIQLKFQGNGQARVDYFECGSPTPTRSKVITWSSAVDAGIGG